MLSSNQRNKSEATKEALTYIWIVLTVVLTLGSERFAEMMCVAVGVRRAYRKPVRPMKKCDLSGQVEEQQDFGF